MTPKKVFTVILMLLVIFSLGASYIFTGTTPPQPVAPSEEPENGFVGPTGAPFVNGPTTPPPVAQ